MKASYPNVLFLVLLFSITPVFGSTTTPDQVVIDGQQFYSVYLPYRPGTPVHIGETIRVSEKCGDQKNWFTIAYVCTWHSTLTLSEQDGLVTGIGDVQIDSPRYRFGRMYILVFAVMVLFSIFRRSDVFLIISVAMAAFGIVVSMIYLFISLTLGLSWIFLFVVVILGILWPGVCDEREYQPKATHHRLLMSALVAAMFLIAP